MQTSDSGCISIKLCLEKQVIVQIRPAGYRSRICINSGSAKNNIRNSDGKKKKDSNTDMKTIRKNQKKFRSSKVDL